MSELSEDIGINLKANKILSNNVFTNIKLDIEIVVNQDPKTVINQDQGIILTVMFFGFYSQMIYYPNIDLKNEKIS